MSNALTAMPAGFHLQYYDDCGIEGRQPHILAEGLHTYSTAEVHADVKVRSVAWGWREVRAAYEGLRADTDYVVAITYANEAYNNRVQSLWAGKIEIHGPHPLPKGVAERLLFRVPREAIAVPLPARTRDSVIRSMVDLAAQFKNCGVYTGRGFVTSWAPQMASWLPSFP